MDRQWGYLLKHRSKDEEKKMDPVFEQVQK